jgi:hypothetical protein
MPAAGTAAFRSRHRQRFQSSQHHPSSPSQRGVGSECSAGEIGIHREALGVTMICPDIAG